MSERSDADSPATQRRRPRPYPTAGDARRPRPGPGAPLPNTGGGADAAGQPTATATAQAQPAAQAPESAASPTAGSQPAGRRNRVAFALGLTALGLLLAGACWVAITGLIARSHLEHVKAELPQLRTALISGDLQRTRALTADIAAAARSAHALTSGPAWWVAANIPALGTPLATGRTLARQADVVGHGVLPGVERVATEVSALSHVSNSTIDLGRLADLAPQLGSAARAADSATRAVRSAPPSWLGAVSSARSSVLAALVQVDDELTGVNRAVQIAVPMLGESGPKRYMIGFMNEAEARGLGGIPGAFAIVTADHGRITFTHFGSDQELYGVSSNVDLGAEFDARYGPDDPAGYFQNSDMSPHFPDAARIWAGMWQAKTGQRLDGAIAVDPTALHYLLRVTGPVRTATGQQVKASNVVALTQQTQYSLYGKQGRADKAARKRFLSDMAKAIAQRLTQGAPGADTLRALSKAAGQRRLMVWSADASVEAQLVDSGWSGALDASGGPFSGFVVNNAAGTKLDYYLDRTMSYARSGCGANSTVVATFKMTNHTPAQPLPVYVTRRLDRQPAGAVPGDNRLLVTYYGTRGSRLRSVQLDGKPLTLATGTEQGLTTVTVDVELPAGATRTLTVTMTEPAADAPTQILEQPLARPMVLTRQGSRC